nr:hypothetical protein [Tanacetum cinerariifolium]
MTPSTIATVTTSNDAPIPPTLIPSDVLQNLPTFNSVFHFDKRLRDEDDDDNDEEEETAKIDEPEDTESGGDDGEVTESDREDDL